MNNIKIKYLEISNFRSIDTIILTNINNYSAFVGANGSGNSNFFDTLCFVSFFIRNGIQEAIKQFGGINNIKNIRLNAKHSNLFKFRIQWQNNNHTSDQCNQYNYQLLINLSNHKSEINEEFSIVNENGDQINIYTRQGSEGIIKDPTQEKTFFIPYELSILLFVQPEESQAISLLRHIRIYRIEPFITLISQKSDIDDSVLQTNGSNLASVLARLEQDHYIRESIIDWMNLIVPGIEQIRTEQKNIEIDKSIIFKEDNQEFPANMMSTGTIYALAILVAVLDIPPYGLTLIEEPERGLHPQAIFELVDLFRDQALHYSPIWITSQSESVVRKLQLDELWLIDKTDGITQIKSANTGNLKQNDLAPLGLDELWLSNLLRGGLAW